MCRCAGAPRGYGRLGSSLQSQINLGWGEGYVASVLQCGLRGHAPQGPHTLKCPVTELRACTGMWKGPVVTSDARQQSIPVVTRVLCLQHHEQLTTLEACALALPLCLRCGTCNAWWGLAACPAPTPPSSWH